MNKRVKLAIAALLGFSAACSSVKNAPKQGEEQNTPVETVEPDGPARIVVMYGVRPPVSPSVDDASRSAEGAELDPVAEAPQTPDAGEKTGNE